MSDSILDAIQGQVLFIWGKVYLLICVISFIFVSYHFGKALVTYSHTGEFPDTFVSNREKMFDNNKFQQIVFPRLDDYDVELAIPPGQILHSTVQGNWGFSTDPNGDGLALGVYRDGYSADGSIFKGKSGKRYKRMLEQGPYTIKYETRKSSEQGHDVKIYVNEKLIHNLQNEGVSSDKLKVLGTNYANYNDLTQDKSRGRRKIDYIKFIPKQSNKIESFTSTRDSKRVEYTENKLKMYFTNIKNAETVNSSPEEIQKITKELFDDKWKGFEYAGSIGYYLIHKEAASGIPASDIIETHKDDFLAGLDTDPYFNKKFNDEIAKKIANTLGYEKKEELAKMMEKAISKIKAITFTVKPINIGENKESNFKKISEKVPYKIEPRFMKQQPKNRVPQAEVISATSQKDLFCPKNCVKPSLIDGNCGKDIIRMVVEGQDKFYRKCSYRCKDRFEKDYENYDKSGPGNPYDVKRDGCRYTQAHCVSNCNKVLVEVDEQGRDLNALANNYTRTSETEKYAKSRLFATKATTGLFGANDNRLGGSKTAYKTDYKPQDPNPKQGPINYDAIWDFSAK